MTTTLVDAEGRELTIRRGTSPTHTFAIVDQTTGDPKNLTGATEVTLAFARNRGATERLFELVLDDGITHDGAGGIVSAAFTKEQTEAMSKGRRWVELWITDDDGIRDLIAEGYCTVYDTLITVGTPGP